jgi:hypothetical protein
VEVGRVRDVLDRDRALAAAADVGAVVGQRQPGVEAARAQVVAADLLQGAGQVGGPRGGREQERGQEGDEPGRWRAPRVCD